MTAYHDERARPRITAWPRYQTAPIDLSGHALGFNTQKTLQGPEGQFQIELLPRSAFGRPESRVGDIPSLYRALRPGSVISLGMEEPGGIMLGIVNRVDRTSGLAAPVGGQRSQGLRVSGSDFGKILAQDGIVHPLLSVGEGAKIVAKLEPVVGPDHVLLEVMAGHWFLNEHDGVPGQFKGAGVAEVLAAMLEAGISTQLPQLAHVAGGSAKPADLISTAGSITTWNDARIWSAGFNTLQGSLWDFLWNVLDRDFYEAVIQTAPNGNALPGVRLVVRPKPFDEPAMEFAPVNESTGLTWKDLKPLLLDRDHEVLEHEALGVQLGVSDHDTFAYYEVSAVNDLIGNPSSKTRGLYYPLIDTYGLKLGGLRQYQARLALMGADTRSQSAGQFDDSELYAEVQEFRNRLFNWYRLNHVMETGSITVRGRDRYRPGDPIRVPWLQPVIGAEKGLRFYTTGVGHSWRFGGEYTTRLDVTRGHNNGVVAAAIAEIVRDAPPSNPQHYAAI